MNREPVAIFTVLCIVLVVLYGINQKLDASTIGILSTFIGGAGAASRQLVTPVADPKL